MENFDMTNKIYIMLQALDYQSDFAFMNFTFYVNAFQPSHDNKKKLKHFKVEELF